MSEEKLEAEWEGIEGEGGRPLPVQEKASRMRRQRVRKGAPKQEAEWEDGRREKGGGPCLREAKLEAEVETEQGGRAGAIGGNGRPESGKAVAAQQAVPTRSAALRSADSARPKRRPCSASRANGKKSGNFS